MAWAEFTENDYVFFKNEFNLDRAEIDAMDDDAQDSLYAKCLDIELEETPDSGGELSDRGEMAVRLVDLIHGPYDSAEFEAEMAEGDSE